MTPRNRFQYEVATGRASLPVAILLTVVVWGFSSIHEWGNAGSLLAFGITAYLLLELDTRFALIRTRTTLPACLFLLFYAAIPSLHSWSVSCLLPPVFTCMLSSLFRSYESAYASTTIFHAFLCLGLCSLIVPPLGWLAPLLLLHMVNLRSLSAKTFFASLLGFALPYWGLFCYSIYIDQVSWFIPYMERLTCFSPIKYNLQDIVQYLSWGILLLLTVIYGTLYLRSAYKDKVQTRIIMQTLLWITLWINLLIAVQPQYIDGLLPLVALSGSLFGGHLFALTFNRFTRILFYTTLFLLGGLCLVGLWMHSFNF